MFVEQVMTTQVVTVRPETMASQAWELLQEGHFRHLPVVRFDHLVGMVSDRDLRVARALAEEPTVGRLGRQDPITVEPDTPVEEASRLMLEHKIGALPVVDDGVLVGIVTESDLFRMLTRVMGVLEPSSRLQLELDEPTPQLADVTRIAYEHQTPIVSLVTEPGTHGCRRVVVLRVRTIDPEPLIRDLERAGVRVIGPVPA
jgi:acetoin utilization protein AcuB